MTDPYLFELLHTVSLKQKERSTEGDRYSLAYEKAIQSRVAALLEDQINENQFLSREQLQKKIENEVRQATSQLEFGEYLKEAVQIFRTDAIRYLEPESYQALLNGLNLLAERVELLDLENLTDQDLYDAFGGLMQSSGEILKIATSKFEEGLIRDSLAIFTFLTLVQSNEPDFWFRMGLIAQKDRKIELALRAFNTAQELGPQMIGPHIYAALCFFNQGLKEEALGEVHQAKTKQMGEEWKEELSAIEALISSPLKEQ